MRVLTFAAGFAVAAIACASLPSASDEASAVEYETRQLACVAEAGTREQADACRCAVRVQFKRDCDGGVP